MLLFCVWLLTLFTHSTGKVFQLVYAYAPPYVRSVYLLNVYVKKNKISFVKLYLHCSTTV